MRVWVLAAAIMAALLAPVLADDWVVVKLRGQVVQLIGKEWQPLRRGDVVSDDRVIRTLAGGRVEFRREKETISLGPETQIQIHDRTDKRFTTVEQAFGEVAVEAEIKNVQHFEVSTPFMAAVVKGTRFVVHSDKDSSHVEVQRGHVAVESEVTHSTTLIGRGQSATAARNAELQVAGKGDLPPVVSASGEIISEDGKPVLDEKEAAALAKKLAAAAGKATGEEKKALEKAAKEAEKAAMDAAKAEEKATRDADKAADKAAKDAEKAAEKSQKDAEKTQKEAAKKDNKDKG